MPPGCFHTPKKLQQELDEEVMPQLLGRQYTTLLDTKMTGANCAFLYIFPVHPIIEKQIVRESVGIFDSNKTIPIPIVVIPECVDDECLLLKLPTAKQKDKGGNTLFVIQTSKIKEQCSEFSSHFGRDLWNDKLVRVIAGGDTLRKLISSLQEGPHALMPLLVSCDTRNTFTLMVSALSFMQISRPRTCLILKGGSEEEEDSHRLPPRDWSSLPCLLLWMIKEKLDFFDNAKVALVCSHWWHASINNPTKMQTVGDDGRPWIMIHPSPGTDKWEIFNIERTKRICLELPEFYDSHPFSSRQGWIFFKRNYVCKKKNRKGQLVKTLLLINPLTKSKIQLGDLIIDRGGPESGVYCCGCFSSSKDGFPSCIVISAISLEKYEISHYITTITINPCGDRDDDKVLWTKESYVVKGYSMIQHPVGSTIINYHVYCCFPDGGMIIYDIGGHSWREIQPPLPLSCWPMFHMMEREGCVVIYAFARELLILFKYSHTLKSWQRLANNDNDANNLMIFAERSHVNYSVRIQTGLKSYKLVCQRRKVFLSFVDYFARDQDFSSQIDDFYAYWVDIG